MSSLQLRAHALLLETDALVAERARRLLAAEGYATCWVDEGSLFDALRASHDFDLHLVGVVGPEQLEGLPELGQVESLVLMAPVSHPSQASPYRVALPRALLLDRALRDPDVLRQVLDRPERGGPALEADPVRQTFAPFGLSERQLEVLASALTGATSREIAGELFISELTVRNHLHAIYERIGVSGRRELLGRFVRGLMEAHA